MFIAHQYENLKKKPQFLNESIIAGQFYVITPEH